MPQSTDHKGPEGGNRGAHLSIRLEPVVDDISQPDRSVNVPMGGDGAKVGCQFDLLDVDIGYLVSTQWHIKIWKEGGCVCVRSVHTVHFQSHTKSNTPPPTSTQNNKRIGWQ